MKYLYGDSTPFPLAENFLASARAATETCVALLRVDELAAEGRGAIRESEKRAAQELARLEALGRRIEEVFGPTPSAGAPPNPTECATARIGEHARVELDQARAEVLRWKETAALEAAKAAPLARVLPTLGAFLAKHQLPQTGWSLRWGAGFGSAGARAEAYARTQAGLEAVLDVEVPKNHLWARPVRVSMLDAHAVIHLFNKPWIGKTRLEPVPIERMHVTAITHMPDHGAIRLGESARGPSRGIEIVLKSAGSPHPTATRIDVDGAAISQPERLGPEDSLLVHRLWSRIEPTLCDLIWYRKHATAAMLRGVPVDEIVHPAVIAEVIIEAVAPVIREMARRSATPGELALKRHLGDGRREELFVPYDAVLAGIDTLQPAHRAMFDAYGLGEKTAPLVRLVPPLPRVPHLRAVND